MDWDTWGSTLSITWLMMKAVLSKAWAVARLAETTLSPDRVRHNLQMVRGEWGGWCPSVPVSQCHSVTLSQCHSVTLSQCHSRSVTVSHFHSVTMSVLRWFALQSARYGDPHVHQIERVFPHHEGLYTCVVGNGKDQKPTGQ